MKLTDWFQGDVKPIRVGIYERRYKSGIYFSKWNGIHWGFGHCKVKFANLTEDFLSQYQNLPWRGLSKDPKGGE